MSDFYRDYNIMYFFKLIAEAFVTKNAVKRQSMINRSKDYLSLSKNTNLLELHKNINGILETSINKWNAYDYGQSYYYQGFKRLSITGLRNTESRIKEMELTSIAKGKNVLEIGSNAGFISLILANYASSVTAIENNPFLVEISNSCKKFLNQDNIKFVSTKFENYKINKQFDLVLSFANHSTIDNQISLALNDYFFKCSKLLSQNGMIVFESHPPGFEKPSLENTLKIISKYFEIILEKKITKGTKLDKGRTVVIGKLKH